MVQRVRVRSIRRLTVVLLTAAAGCGGCSQELATWPGTLVVSGTTVLELEPPVHVPSMWGQAAELTLCFDALSSEGPTTAGGEVRTRVAARSLDEPAFQAMTATVRTSGPELHALREHQLLGRAFCLSGPPLVQGRQRAFTIEISSPTPVTLVGLRLLRVTRP